MKRLTIHERRLLRSFAHHLSSATPARIFDLYATNGGLQEFARIIREKVAPPDGNERRTLDIRRARHLVAGGLPPRRAAAIAREVTVDRPLTPRDAERVEHIARELTRKKGRKATV